MVAYSNYEYWKTTPITGEPYLSVVVSTWHEQRPIAHTLEHIAAHISCMGFPWELLIAHDGADASVLVGVDALNFANLVLVQASPAGTKGSTMQSGVMAARGRYILCTSATNAAHTATLDTLLHTVAYEAYDIVVAARPPEEADEPPPPWHQHLLHEGLQWTLQHLFALSIYGLQCDCTIFRRKTAHHLHMLQTISGPLFDVEILYLARKLGYKVCEVAAEWQHTPAPVLHFDKATLSFLFNLFKIKQNDHNGIYDVSLPWSDQAGEAELAPPAALTETRRQIHLPS